MPQQFGENFAPNLEICQGFLLLVRILPPNSIEDRKQGLHRNLVVSFAGIWELSATFSSKRPRRFFLMGKGSPYNLRTALPQPFYTFFTPVVSAHERFPKAKLEKLHIPKFSTARSQNS